MSRSRSRPDIVNLNGARGSERNIAGDFERDLDDQESTGPLIVPPDWDRTKIELQKLLEETREVIKDGHILLRDLRTESKQARRILPMIVAKRISAEVETQVAALGSQTAEAMRRSVEKVTREFDKLAGVYLGTDHVARKEGRISLQELIEEYHEKT